MTGDWIGSTVDDLAAGDEVEDVEGVLRHISGQLEAIGGGDSANLLGHIVVPKRGASLAIPAGRTQVSFKDGYVKHEDQGTIAEISTVSDISPTSDSADLSLKNLIVHADSVVGIESDNTSNQQLPFQDVPIPFEGFEEITLEAPYPCEVAVLASTDELPIGLGAVTANGQRHGRASGTFDSLNAVPVAPFATWDEYGAAEARAPVYVAMFDSTTITVDNTGSNELRAVVEARENRLSSSAKWRETASDTIPAGDHSIFNVGANSERHKELRTRVENTTTGQTVAASVDYNMANP